MFADLHLHTNFSDGTYSPEELVAQAQAKGLAALALTGGMAMLRMMGGAPDDRADHQHTTGHG